MKKKYQGMHAYRYEDNPLERAAALAFQEWDPNGHNLDYMLSERNDGLPGATDEQRLAINTVIQWLGSPVGIEFVHSTFGDEILRRQREKDRRENKAEVRPLQVYESRDRRDVGRCVMVENNWQQFGKEKRWLVHNMQTGRRSYIGESSLLDPVKWRLV